MKTGTLRAAALGLILVGCESEQSSPAAAGRDKPVVCTTLYPVHYFTQRIAGDLATVDCLVPAGADAMHWRPGDDEIRAMQGADLIVFNGADAETWAFSLALPFSRVEETAAVLRKEFIKREGITHSHGGGESHTHDGVDPNTWMDPRQAARQGDRIRKALIKLLPDASARLQSNYEALARDLEGLHEIFGRVSIPEGQVLLAAQPDYDYLARRHGWNVVNLDLDATTPPDPATLAVVKTVLAGRTARAILWPAEPHEAWADALGMTYVVVPTCASVPAEGEPEYLEAMRGAANRMATALK